MLEKSALIFDYDGVLANTEVLHWKSWAALLQASNIPLSWEDYCATGRGVNDTRFVEVIRQRNPSIDLSQLGEQNTARNQRVRQLSLTESPISAQTIQLFNTLGGHRLGLVTSSERSHVQPVVQAAGIFDRFSAAVFGDDVTAHKPAPDPYLLIARKMGIKTGVAFEDSAAGIESALAAGFGVVPIADPSELSQAVTGYLRGEIIPQIRVARS
jgi:beta-phosphoglucomutase